MRAKSSKQRCPALRRHQSYPLRAVAITNSLWSRCVMAKVNNYLENYDKTRLFYRSETARSRN